MFITLLGNLSYLLLHYQNLECLQEHLILGLLHKNFQVHGLTL